MATCPTCKTRYPDDVRTCAADGEPLLPDEALAAADATLVEGQVVGEYRVEGKLGEGGFGAVYRAVHPVIGKAAAVKVLHKQYSSNPQMVSRFIAEARAVNQIRNRNIIDIFAFGTLSDGRQFYVMELLDGMPMDKYLDERGRLPVDDAVPILRGIARAIDAAHGAGIAHRDLKPENVFLSFDEDGKAIPKLLDFGIAKLLGEAGTGHKTRTGTPMGTPYYMSPEQCRGRNVDHRTDIYSFGIVIFQTLTGELPFQGEDVMEILVKNTSAPAPRPSLVCPELPPALDDPILAFLEKDPDKRPATLGAGLDALAHAAAGAGFDVKVSARKPDDAVTSKASGNVRLRTGDTPADAESRTMMVDEGGRTMLAAEAAPKQAAPRTMLVGVVGVALLAVVGGIALFASRAPAPHDVPPKVAATSAPAAPTVAAPTAAPTVSPAAPVSASVTAEPAALPDEIDLTVDADPKVVDVYQGATKLGSTSGPVKLKRADGKTKLTFKAAGYASQDVDVPSSANTVVSVKLKRVVSSKKGDLEF
jgi:serine/threonine-protein kinase